MVDRILDKVQVSAKQAPAGQPLNKPGQWDFSLSHGQAAAGEQAKVLCFLLRGRKKPNGTRYTVWYTTR